MIVDSLWSYNTGNVMFLRIGERRPPLRGRMENIFISNLYAEVPATKADAGYHYEGPVEDLPRNVSPSSIVGLPGVPIKNVALRNVEIHYPGGGDSLYARVGLDELGNIPELPAKYPEFSMFKELPAWGFYIRHAQDVTFDNVKLVCENEDYRTAIVLDDVQRAIFKSLDVKDPIGERDPVFQYKSTEITIESRSHTGLAKGSTDQNSVDLQ